MACTAMQPSDQSDFFLLSLAYAAVAAMADAS